MFIEYFPDGSDDCPLILMHGCEPDAIFGLCDRVVALAAERIQGVAVHELPGFESVNSCRLFLQTGNSDNGTYALSEAESFECRLRPASWDTFQWKLRPFTIPLSNNHFQYLDNHGDIQLLVSGHRGW